MNITEFARKHDLCLCASERPEGLRGSADSMRWFAYFLDADIHECVGGSAIAAGNGATREAAIVQYAENIQGRTLVVYPGGKLIQAPADLTADVSVNAGTA